MNPEHIRRMAGQLPSSGFHNPFQEASDRLAAAIGHARPVPPEEMFDRVQTPEDKEFLKDAGIEVEA